MQQPAWLFLALMLMSSPRTFATVALDEGHAAVVSENEALAQAELDKALKHARKGQYKDAHRRYRLLAKKYPDTKAGRIATRRATPSAFLSSTDLVRHGPSSNRIDVVLMGEGYTLKHQKAWDKLAEDVPAYFERQRTLGEYFSYFNFIRANLVSAEEGVDGFGREYDTALNAKTRKTYAGHVGIDGKRVHTMLDEIPEHDSQAIVYVKRGLLGTGGSGIATIGGQSIKTTIHEFGHSFGRLGDEYSTETHKRSGKAAAPNITSSEEPDSAPWKHWLGLRGANVGLYEGAGGRVRGAWKPTSSGCVMSSTEFFCRVCREHLVLRIYSYVDPIESCSPPHAPLNPRAYSELRESTFEFTVTVMQPASHELDVDWWVLPESEAPLGAGSRDPMRYGERKGSVGGRSARGRLPRIDTKPFASTHPKRDGKHTFTLRRSKLDPGRYRVIARAHDSTKFRGERYPWVLKDDGDLLWSERGWWIEVLDDRGKASSAGDDGGD